MRTPRRLIGQVAAESGVTPTTVKLGLYLRALATRPGGCTLAYAAKLLKRQPSTVRGVCRRFVIDLSDYRPFSRLERAGEPRPNPVADLGDL